MAIVVRAFISILVFLVSIGVWMDGVIVGSITAEAALSICISLHQASTNIRFRHTVIVILVSQ